MSQRSKNLLEAFTQSKAPEKSAEPVAEPRGSAARVGGPFADGATKAATPVHPRSQDPRPAPVVGTNSSPSRGRLLVLGVAIAVTFFFVGRISVPGVQAAGDSAGQDPAPPKTAAVLPAAVLPAPVGVLSNETALLDRANQATILAITYKLSDDNERLARDTCARMIAQQLPAAVWRNPEKKQISLLVGAAPRQIDLDEMLVRVKAAVSERGKQEFTTAYIVPIDNYIVRPAR